jgi:glutaminase
VYEVGDSRQLFTIQSISKPFVYGLALEDNGEHEVFKKVDVEPTGDAFNSISLDPQTSRPLNPMINAGAIAVSGSVRGKDAHEKLHRILHAFSLYAGREVGIDHIVYQSEKITGHRNRAIGHMLRNFDILTEDPEPVLDLYFQQCSIAVDCHDLAIMAASLANGGVNPITGQRAVRQENVEKILSIMASWGCTIMRESGFIELACRPKAVSGGILAVLPDNWG